MLIQALKLNLVSKKRNFRKIRHIFVKIIKTLALRIVTKFVEIFRHPTVIIKDKNFSRNFPNLISDRKNKVCS